MMVLNYQSAEYKSHKARRDPVIGSIFFVHTYASVSTRIDYGVIQTVGGIFFMYAHMYTDTHTYLPLRIKLKILIT